MKKQHLAWPAAVLAIGACRATGPSPAVTVTAAARPAVAVAAAVVGVQNGWRDEINGLLDDARDAAATGTEDEFRDCETAVVRSLQQAAVRDGHDPEFVQFLADAMDALDEMQETFVEDPQTDERPPEPGPVPAERVVGVQELSKGLRFDLPVIINAEVTSLIDFYSGRYRERFAVALQRSARYVPFIKEELRKAELPEDLAYLPMVESAFNPRARSRARAQGLWQFVSGTARRYDLCCDGMVDERNDPYLSTKAATVHLKDLYDDFGSWELVLAAYNSGPGRVQRALRRGHGETDYWRLRKYLPRETRNYVPALWAVLVIVKNPQAFGLPPIDEDPQCFEHVAVNDALDLDVLAQHSGINVELLADLNPALVHRMTPLHRTFALAVPCGRASDVTCVLGQIPRDEWVRRILHVVRPGDTPAALARKYGSSVDGILQANHLRSARSLRIGQTLVIPRLPNARLERGSGTRAHASSVHARSASSQRPPVPKQRYVVRRGDTLYKIARRFGTSVDELQRRNSLGGSAIHPGDVIHLAP